MLLTKLAVAAIALVMVIDVSSDPESGTAEYIVADQPRRGTPLGRTSASASHDPLTSSDAYFRRLF